MKPVVEKSSIEIGRYWLPMVTMVVLLFALGTVIGSMVLLHRHQAPEDIEVFLLLAASALLVAMVLKAISERKKELKRIRQYLSSLELLAEASAAIGSKVGSSGEVLKRLPQMAVDVLGMSMAQLSLLEENGTMVRAIASAGVHPPVDGTLFRVDDLPTVKRAIETRAVITVSDLIADQTTPINRGLVKAYSLRSVMQTPLLIGDEVIGVLLLGDKSARVFSAQDVRLAQLWCAQAAVTIANDRLYSETRQALESRDLLLRHRDALFVVSGQLSRPGALREVLQRITDLSPALLEVDVCQVALIVENTNEIEMAAVTSKYAGDLIGTRVPLEGTNSQRVLKSGTSLIVEDGSKWPLHPALSRGLPTGSLVFFPLFNSKHEPLGGLVLMRKNTGAFARQQIALAEMFCLRAAGAIENAKLNEQTRNDAQAKAMLLRELNHRVKNNFAGIVALLSLNEPDLSPAARQWLDRAIDRIRTMSRTHEMFTGNTQRVGLKELIDQTVQSLSVAKPPDVALQTDVNGAVVFLRNDRAVSLAMVLHELCYNALVHGVSQTGTVTIKAGGQAQGSMWLEIMDDGHKTGVVNNVASSHHTGMGLTLVQGLVSRELHGRFNLTGNEAGGMTARIEMPLLDDEIQDAPL